MQNKKKRRALSVLDRRTINAMRGEGYGIREIAKFIGRDCSIISRELRRNRAPIRLRLSEIEQGDWAHALAQSRLKARKRGKRCVIKRPGVQEHIIDQLLGKMSPEAISATMEGIIGIKVSYSTIYRWVKRDVPELKSSLYEKGKKRRTRVMNRRGRFQEAAALKRSHAERPPEANTRSEPGHLEGDTIHGCKGTSAAVLSIRDRKTRNHWFEKVANLEAATVTRAIIRLLHTIPPALRRTLTFDRGSEFADWSMIERIFPDCKVYFCDPYCPYQKGSNERGNRDLRKYYPKGTSFDDVTNEEIRVVQQKINAHPMKLHKWRSPSAVFEECNVALAA